MQRVETSQPVQKVPETNENTNSGSKTYDGNKASDIMSLRLLTCLIGIPAWLLSALYFPILHLILNTVLIVVGLHEFDSMILKLTGLPYHRILHHLYLASGVSLSLVATLTNSYLALRNAMDVTLIFTIGSHLVVAYTTKQTRIAPSALTHLCACLSPPFTGTMWDHLAVPAFFGLYWVAFSVAHGAFILSGGRGYMALLLFSNWGSDSCAMLIGRTFGRHKLFPVLSPKKTWEGFLAGCIVGGLIPSLLLYPLSRYWAALPQASLMEYVVPCLCCSTLTQCGDLIESFVKRAVGVKDSGNFFPGHGGVLDRICGLFFAAPFMVGWMRGAIVPHLSWIDWLLP